ncbi:hypothetical protein FHEFKHOI_00612 [Candidatus Methanoperedenaceae archaeon GB50]|nr:hypothetical protein AIOGIFDO_00610 [Candidatus Methanoperedenaceae archaeon GB37]CAD7769497.1 hypothetical protein FHEFKHOI_00612 [Candidatus Methanoperedenaceae archaeon GB50]CAD7778595.1 MAG: hypothetical protein KBONHNOK_01176 [Candidatus Methanoperedenaceae archaeon GB50]
MEKRLKMEMPGEISLNLQDYWHIIKLTRKPTWEEFKTITKIAGGGILLIGFIGFVIYLLLTELPQTL